MCVCGWQLITLAVITQLLIITYGELDGRRRSKTDAERTGHQE